MSCDLSLVVSSLEYFLALTSDTHREAWTPVLLLLLTRALQLSTEEVGRDHAHQLVADARVGGAVCGVCLIVHTVTN